MQVYLDQIDLFFLNYRFLDGKEWGKKKKRDLHAAGGRLELIGADFLG